MSDETPPDNLRKIRPGSPPLEPQPKREESNAVALLKQIVDLVNLARREQRFFYDATYDNLDALEKKIDSQIHSSLWIMHAIRHGIEYADSTMVSQVRRDMDEED